MKVFFITVIVPAYNSESTIALCIESLLNQNYPKERYEIIIVDNNSKDKTATIIKRYPVKYLLEDKIQTAYAARNTGIRNSRGEIIACTDSDCVADKNWILEGIKPFKDTMIVGVGGKILPFQAETYIEKYHERMQIFNQERFLSDANLEKRMGYIAGGNAFYRKFIFDEIGLFNEQWVGGGDNDLSFRIQKMTRYNLYYKPEAIVFHKHATSLKKLAEQFFRYGSNDVLLRHKYSATEAEAFAKVSGKIKPFYWRVRCGIIMNIILTFKNTLVCLIRFNEKNKLKLIDSFLRTVEQAASFCGAWKACKKNNIPMYYIIPAPSMEDRTGKNSEKF